MGKDGQDGQLYILQARPETVKSRLGTARVQRYRIRERGAIIIEGRAIGQKIGAGAARVLSEIADMHLFQPGEVLVADMPNVRNSSGAIGTMRCPISLSRIRSRNSRTNAWVVATLVFSPAGSISAAYTSSPGNLMMVGRTRRSGR